MGKRDGEILAFLHFAVTEMRPIWLLWYTVFNTFKNIVTGASISDAYNNGYVTKCLYETTLNAKGIADCAKSAYKRYLAYGPQKPYRECSEICPGSGVGIDVPEPRSMFFFMTFWLFGFLLVLLVYFIYHHPDYHTGSYIKFTQNLYGSKAYKIVAKCTSVVSVLVILIGIYLLIKYEKEWTQYVVALLLMVVASRSLVRNKSNGLDIHTEKFCNLEISRGNALMWVLNLFLTTNAALLDEMEVQLIKKQLPDDLVAVDEREEGCLAHFSWQPLSDKTIDKFLASKNESNGNEMAEKV